MHPTAISPAPHTAALDQAAGLRRLFAHARTRFVPVASNPHVTDGRVLLERLCAALGTQCAHTLLVDAGERAPAASEMAAIDLAECIEPLSPQLSYLAARGLHLRYCDARGSTAGLLRAVSDAAPHADVVLVHAPAADLCRLFARHPGGAASGALLLAEDRPAAVTHAYAAMKLLALRAGVMVHDLLLGAAPHSPRPPRIAQQLARCADDFVGALLRDWAQVDPASGDGEAPGPALLRVARALLRPLPDEMPAEALATGFAAHRPHGPVLN